VLRERNSNTSDWSGSRPRSRGTFEAREARADQQFLDHLEAIDGLNVRQRQRRCQELVRVGLGGDRRARATAS
jgi:hypothetical protein